MKDNLDYNVDHVLVMGHGATGQSVVAYLDQRAAKITLWDDKQSTRLTALVPTLVVVSPGIPLSHPLIQSAKKQNIPVIGDIELFAAAVNKPVIGVTGTNGKSTVCALVTELLKAGGFKVGLGGNFGEPALNLLAGDYDIYVLELSSFQLDTTYSLRCKIGTILNITPDHLDRYVDFSAYQASKWRLADMCQKMVLPQALARHGDRCFDPQLGTDYYIENNRIVQRQGSSLLACDKLSPGLQGVHNQSNILAALGLIKPFSVGVDIVIAVLKSYQGLSYRCERVLTEDKRIWINDSKGTNVGATLAALESLMEDYAGHIVWLAGGYNKRGDFTVLCPLIESGVREAIFFGSSARLLTQCFDRKTITHQVNTVGDAVVLAKKLSQPGEIILFSPACASFDQFSNYLERGKVFSDKVLALG